MKMPQNLQLPEGAAEAFDKCNKFNQDLAKWLVYTTNSVSQSAARELCHHAMKVYNDTTLHVPESEWEEMGFAKPADEVVSDVKAALDKHIATVREVLDSKESDPWNVRRLYPTGFVVVDGNDWREKGVIVVHCDDDQEGGKRKALQTRLKVKDLGFALTTVLDGDDEFKRVAETYGTDSS